MAEETQDTDGPETEDEFLARVRALLEDAEATITARQPSDRFHAFLAAVQGVDQLNAGTVELQLRDEYPWYAQSAEGAGSVFELLGLPLQQALEVLGAFADRAVGLLGGWLKNHDLGPVYLMCYLPCHREFQFFTFTPDGALLEGKQRA